MSSSRRSEAKLCGLHASHCGYCQSGGDGRVSWGFVSRRVSPADYQSLVDRNWRRSGTFFYKPSNTAACCAQYTIRLDAPRFAPNKSQRRADARMRRYLDTGDVRAHAAPSVVPEPRGAPSASPEAATVRAVAVAALQSTLGAELAGAAAPKVSVAENAAGVAATRGRFSCNAAIVAAAAAKKLTGGAGIGDAQGVAERLTEAMALPAGWSARALNGFVNVFAPGGAPGATASAQGAGPHKRDPPRRPESPRAPAHRLEVSVAPSAMSDEEYALYRKYQVAVHKDDPSELTEKGYRRFLVDSPITRTPLPGSAVLPFGVREYGSYHMQYRIDGRLVAVGVLDVLPACLSSVYLFYDPDESALELGVFSALEEIRFVRGAMQALPELRYYYMGYYIHTCTKMRYKGAYAPSELLCELSRTWVPLDQQCHALLDAAKGKLAKLSSAPELEPLDEEVLFGAAQSLPLLYEGRSLGWGRLAHKFLQQFIVLTMQFVQLVGVDLVENFVLLLD